MGTNFTGCISSGLGDVANHDLDDVGLTDCATREESSKPRSSKGTGNTATTPRPVGGCRPGRFH